MKGLRSLSQRTPQKTAVVFSYCYVFFFCFFFFFFFLTAGDMLTLSHKRERSPKSIPEKPTKTAGAFCFHSR